MWYSQYKINLLETKPEYVFSETWKEYILDV